MNFGGPMTLGKMITPIIGDIGRSIKAASDAPARLTVESIDNHVYFYADVDSDRCLSMIRQIREIDIRLRTEQISRPRRFGCTSSPVVATYSPALRLPTN
jgi:hypothetical protein